MNADSTTHDDLAFLRNLLEGDRGGRMRRKFGIFYFVSGIVWAPNLLFEWLHVSKLVPIPQTWVRGAWLATLIIFAVAMIYCMWPDRSVAKTTANRAFNAAFAGIGYSYLAVLIMLTNLAWQRNSNLFFLIYVVVVFAGQGAGWFVAWTLQRQAWLAFVAFGWYVAALITGLNVLSVPNFLLSTGISMLLLMALPGWVMVRKSNTPEAPPNVEPVVTS